MVVPIVFLDANVLYPAALRSLLMYLALFEVFQARWSDEVQEEWISNLLGNRPDLTRAQLEKTRRLMDVHAPGALVTGYEQLVSGLSLPDPKDRHVLAAAIHGEASVIVTQNLKDFPSERLDEYSIKAQLPDDFILGLIESAPEGARNAAETHRQSLKNPAKTVDEYLATLAMHGLVQVIPALRILLLSPTA